MRFTIYTMLHNTINQVVRKFSANTTYSIRCKRLEGKVAIVTASTEGIGFSIAKRLAQEGAKVMISSRKELNVKNAMEKLQSEGLEVAGTVCHVGKTEDREKLLEKTKTDFGGLDILISNAATNPTVGMTVLECTEKAWDKVFDINVKSTYLLMKESLPLLKQSKSPSIIMISSVAGYDSINLLGVYPITKTALFGLCKVTANELALDNIRVNCIAPGIIKTKFSNVFCKTDEEYQNSLLKISMHRFGLPDEVAGTAAFLASDDASYITGETIVVSGGMKSRL